MAFSVENPPIWFRIIVYGVIVIFAIGLVFLAERRGLEKWIDTLDTQQVAISTLFEERLDSVAELSGRLKSEEVQVLKEFGIQLEAVLPAGDISLLGVEELSHLYLSLDDLLNDCVIELSKEYGKAIPSPLLIPVRELMANEMMLGDHVAVYHSQLLNYERAVTSVLNIFAVSVMELPDYGEFTMISALQTPY